MKIGPNSYKIEWNQFISRNDGSFLQSWQWGSFQESLGRKIWRIETQGLKGLVIKYGLPTGKNYLYCPRGPVGQDAEIKSFLKEVKEIAKHEKSIFLKLEPGHDYKLLDYRFKKSSKQIQPLRTLILDLDKPEQEILSAMHQKTRYSIRLAQRKGIKVKSSNYDQIDTFLDLLVETAKRNKFHIHSKDYYRKMVGVLDPEGIVKIFLAKRQDRVIAANLIGFFGKTVTYLHGASDYEARQTMASYLLQWHTIRQAKELGFKYYDFWGIDDKKWPGVTRFKKGFNGKEVAYPGSFDLPYRSGWYTLYNLARRIL